MCNWCGVGWSGHLGKIDWKVWRVAECGKALQHLKCRVNDGRLRMNHEVKIMLLLSLCYLLVVEEMKRSGHIWPLLLKCLCRRSSGRRWRLVPSSWDCENLECCRCTGGSNMGWSWGGPKIFMEWPGYGQYSPSLDAPMWMERMSPC